MCVSDTIHIYTYTQTQTHVIEIQNPEMIPQNTKVKRRAVIIREHIFLYMVASLEPWH